MAKINIERIARRHDRAQFESGEPSLDVFLQALVFQYENRKLGRTFVAVEEDSPRVLGYYTLAAGTLAPTGLPANVSKKLPRHAVPTVHLGRLAVDRSARGRRIGEQLLMNALTLAFSLSENLGAFAVDVIALNNTAQSFYLKYGFLPLIDNPLHLVLPMKTIEGLLQAEP